MRPPIRPLVALVLLLATACRAGEPRAARAGDPPHADSARAAEEAANRRRVDSLARAGGVIDSILPIAEHLRRFRATLAERPDTLRYAARSREEVARRWVAAVAARDTVALRRLAIDRAEFASLFYETNRLARPPYEMPPELLWSQLLLNSEDGGKRALTVLGGHRVSLVSLDCPQPAVAEGANRLHEGCTAVLDVDGARRPATRVFGTILERDGRYKLVGLSGKL